MDSGRPRSRQGWSPGGLSSPSSSLLLDWGFTPTLDWRSPLFFSPCFGKTTSSVVAFFDDILGLFVEPSFHPNQSPRYTVKLALRSGKTLNVSYSLQNKLVEQNELGKTFATLLGVPFFPNRQGASATIMLDEETQKFYVDYPSS